MNALDTARQWLDLGISTIPIRAGSKKPALRWQPYQERLPRGEELRAWWGRDGYGLAVLTGQRGLAVIDFDDLWLYSCWLSHLSRSLALIALTTYRVRTRRGVHVYIMSGEEAPTRSFKSEGLGFDTRGPGGYVLAPPTIHPSGVPYCGIGRPPNIKAIDSIYELIPEARRVIQEQQETAARLKQRETDLWSRAMQKSSGVAIEAIKRAYSFETLLNQPPNGRHTWSVCCPLHSDTAPSFTVYPDGHAHCFGCGWHGDVIDLYAALHKITVQEAIAEMGAALA